MLKFQVVHECQLFEYGTLIFINGAISEVTMENMQVHFKRHFGHTNVLFLCKSLCGYYRDITL